jgi:hypothetical protein
MIRSTICSTVCWSDPGRTGDSGDADPGEEEPQVVVDLGDRPHGGAGIAAGCLLIDGDGRREALDEVHVGLVHLAQELAGVGGEGLHVAALPFGVDSVEGQGGFPRAGKPSEHNQLFPGDLQIDVFQVVLAGTPDDDIFSTFMTPF